MISPLRAIEILLLALVLSYMAFSMSQEVKGYLGDVSARITSVMQL